MSVAVVEGGEETAGALSNPSEEISGVDHETTFLACQFFGLVGGHNFYAGKPLYGIVNLLSFFAVPLISYRVHTHLFFGGREAWANLIFGAAVINFIRQVISWQIDQYRIAMGTFKDGKGKLIRQFTRIPKENVSSVDQRMTYLLSLFPLGWFGAHFFYIGGELFWMARTLKMWILGKRSLGFGLLFRDQSHIAQGSFKDSEGKIICPSYMQSK